MDRAKPNNDRVVTVGRYGPSVDSIPDPVLVIDADGVLQFANHATDVVLGWDTSELLGTQVLGLVHPDDLNLAVASIATAATKEIGDVITIRIRSSTGSWRPLEIRGRRDIVDGAPRTTMVARDISDRHRFGLDQGDDEMLRSVVANMNSMVVVVDPDGTIRTSNDAVTRLLGLDPDIVRGTNIFDVIHPDERAHVIGSSVALASMESAALDARLQNLNGDWVTCQFTVKNLCDDPVVHGYLISGEIATSLHEARLRAEFLAAHDTRTGLLNRDGFLRTATALVGEGGGLGLIIIDITRFRSINELYGEVVGDAVLTSVADRLQAMSWPGLLTARFGGDEFVVAIPSHDDTTITLLRDSVQRELAPPVQVGDLEISLAVRIIGVHDAHPDGLEPLLARASNELMRAKRSTGAESAGPTFESVRMRRARLDDLINALGNGEIQPFFQPIVDADGRVTAVEALVRWVHPERGVLGVNEFLPLARMAGLAEATDDHVLDSSLVFATRLADAGYDHVEVHVNVDPKVIGRSSFATAFLDRCERRGSSARQMVIEITETDLLAPDPASLENISRLRQAGTCVTIDDFGTGFSSLSHLMQLPIDGVKIDQTFVAGIGTDAAATNLTRAILGLSESLNLSCVAEGVEQSSQRDSLATHGCTSFQGWLYSPAVPPDVLLGMLPQIDPSDWDG
jgi:diguanylate cyclase (GGDEF)-like protein/PAS domain S-box-containing protein